MHSQPLHLTFDGLGGMLRRWRTRGHCVIIIWLFRSVCFGISTSFIAGGPRVWFTAYYVYMSHSGRNIDVCGPAARHMKQIKTKHERIKLIAIHRHLYTLAALLSHRWSQHWSAVSIFVLLTWRADGLKYHHSDQYCPRKSATHWKFQHRIYMIGNMKTLLSGSL